MAANLESSIQRVYDGRFYYVNWGNSEEVNSSLKYLVIPLRESDTVEIPTMALEKMCTSDFLNTQYDTIVIPLTARGRSTTYVSIEPMFKEVFCAKPGSMGLVRINVKKGSQIFTYYGSGGAIFDSDFSPILMSSWLFENINGELYVKKPLLRISPHCFSRINPLESFIVGKLLNQTIGMQIFPCYYLLNQFHASYTYTNIRVIVEPIPVQIQSPRTPDINTTTQSLLDLVIDNQEEITCR